MNKYYRCFFSLVLIISPLLLYADQQQNESDSILAIVNKADKQERLELLYKSLEKYRGNISLMKSLDKEATSRGDHFYSALANRSYVYYYAMKGNRDSMKHYLNCTKDHLDQFNIQNNSKEISEDNKKRYEATKIMVVATFATIYIDEGKYNLALSIINKGVNDPVIGNTISFKKQAYCLTGIAYLYTKKPKEALDNFKKAYDIENQIMHQKESKAANVGKYSYYSAMEGAVMAYNFLKEYDESILVADSLKGKLDEEYKQIKLLRGDNSNDDFMYNFFKHRILCYSALANIHLNNLKLARKELDQVAKFVSSISNTTTHQDFDIYHHIEIEYYLSVKDYVTAKKYATNLTKRLTVGEHTYTYLETNKLLSKVLSEEGRSKEAYNLLYDLYNVNDSINAVNFSQEFAEMEAKHELAEAQLMVAEANLKWQNTQKILIILTISFCLSIIISYIIWRNKKELKAKNIQLYKQNKAIELRNIEILKLQSIQIPIEPVEKSRKEDTLDQYDIILEALDNYLLESQAFLDTDITRESVALKIGTNRQYLIEAIKEKSGKTFNEYIYGYRIKYAYELIVNHRNKTISEILQESGFHSRATFYNVFKEIYGMTPSELRGILDEKEID